MSAFQTIYNQKILNILYRNFSRQPNKNHIWPSLSFPERWNVCFIIVVSLLLIWKDCRWNMLLVMFKQSNRPENSQIIIILQRKRLTIKPELGLIRRWRCASLNDNTNLKTTVGILNWTKDFLSTAWQVVDELTEFRIINLFFNSFMWRDLQNLQQRQGLATSLIIPRLWQLQGLHSDPRPDVYEIFSVWTHRHVIKPLVLYKQ